jgi:hypothetical protein
MQVLIQVLVYDSHVQVCSQVEGTTLCGYGKSPAQAIHELRVSLTDMFGATPIRLVTDEDIPARGSAGGGEAHTYEHHLQRQVHQQDQQLPRLPH